MALAAMEAACTVATEPRQHPQARAHQSRRRRSRDPAVLDPHRRQRWSLDPSLYEKYGGITPEAMVERRIAEMAYFHEVDSTSMKISVKASSVPLMVEAYRQTQRRHRRALCTSASPKPGLLPAGWSRPRPASPRC
jgi:(E)-4-hydroxy-3-methylbut-2-enyl-diphosphate synthase